MTVASKNSTRPRIAFVFNHDFFLGGGERSFSELIQNLNRRIYNPIVVVPGQGEIKEYFEGNEASVLVTPFPPLKYILIGHPVFSLVAFCRVLKENCVNIIHANGSRACFYSVLAGRMLSTPVVWHVRETIKDFFFYDGFLGSLAKIIICVSRGVQSKRFERFGTKIGDKIRIIYNGVDTQAFRTDGNKREKTRKKLGVKENEILYGIIGNFIPLKGQDFFLRALARAKEQRPGLRVTLLMVGRALDPTFEKALRRLVSGLKLDSTVLFHDYTQNIAEIFSALDVFVLPSKREGFSRSLLEAMSCGLPILATRLDEVEEAVSRDEGGILIDFGDVEKMGSAIITLCENSGLRKEMGGRNRKRAIERFSLRAHAESVQEIYTKLLFDDL